jgi:tetratricopeptide (TPR) repeat protein
MSTLAEYCLKTPKQHDEAARFYTAALTLRPRSPYITYRLGLALLYKRAYLDAAAQFSRAIELKPDYLDAFLYRASSYERLGRPEEVLADCSKAIELGCKMVQPRLSRGWAYTRLRQWDKARSEFSKVLTMYPTPGFARAALSSRGYAYAVLGRWDRAAADLTPTGIEAGRLDDTWLNVACLRLLNGDTAGYQRICTQLLERAQLGREPFPAEVAALASRTCMLHRDTGTEPRQAVRWAEAAVARQPRWAWYLHFLALAQYRAGQFDAAARSCRRSLEVGPGWEGRAVNWLLLGMAETRRGHTDEGRRWLDKAAQWRAAVLAGKKCEASPPDMPLPDWLEFQVLYQESSHEP